MIIVVDHCRSCKPLIIERHSITYVEPFLLLKAVLKHLVAPRMGMGPEEAYFCSKFFNTLHAIEVPNFNR